MRAFEWLYAFTVFSPLIFSLLFSGLMSFSMCGLSVWHLSYFFNVSGVSIEHCLVRYFNYKVNKFQTNTVIGHDQERKVGILLKLSLISYTKFAYCVL